jgi:two-component system, NtrC family, sensor kinase
MQCPRCQHQNPAATDFCGKCGTPLQRPDGSPQLAPSYADLQRSLTEALERETATNEILQVISGSPTDVQPVFDTIAASASRLCGGVAAIVTRFDGEMIHLVAHHNPRPGIESVTARLYPRRPGRDTTVARAILECSIVHVPDAEKDADLAPNLARDVRAVRRRRSGADPERRGSATAHRAA